MFTYFFRVLRTRGPIFFYIYFVESLFFDIRHRIDTSIRVPKSIQKLSILPLNNVDQEDGLLYVASFSSVLRHTIQFSIDFLNTHGFKNSFQFIDLGCGKGKSLFFVLTYFPRYCHNSVLGIEYDKSLANIASRNLSRLSISSTNYNIICDSAVSFNRYINSEVLIIYLYNSFQGQTLVDVINKMLHLKVVVIYVDPSEDFRFDSLPNFHLLASHSGRYNADTWKIYTNITET